MMALPVLDLPAPSDEEILAELKRTGSHTLLSLAAQMWPGVSPGDLQRRGARFPRTTLAVAPCICLGQWLRALARVGLVLLLPCPGGVHCHGKGARRCALQKVFASPWPPAAVGPVWTVLERKGPRTTLQLELVEPVRGESVAVARIYRSRRPVGTAIVHGDGPGIVLEFHALGGREAEAPAWEEVSQLEEALAESLVCPGRRFQATAVCGRA